VSVWQAWTDGACDPNPGPAGIGFVLLSPDGVRSEGHQGLGDATNNVAELTAILRVAEIVPASDALLIHTDSKYAIGVLVQKWKAKANVELIDRVKAALAKHPAHDLHWVKAHATNLENNVADKLSVLAAKAGSMAAPAILTVTQDKSEVVLQVRGAEPLAPEPSTTNDDLILVMPKKR